MVSYGLVQAEDNSVVAAALDELSSCQGALGPWPGPDTSWRVALFGSNFDIIDASSFVTETSLSYGAHAFNHNIGISFGAEAKESILKAISGRGGVTSHESHEICLKGRAQQRHPFSCSKIIPALIFVSKRIF